MNTSIKAKVNRLGRIGKIIVIILIIAASLNCVKQAADIISTIKGKPIPELPTPKNPSSDFYTTGAWPMHSFFLANEIAVLFEYVGILVIFIFLKKVAEGFQFCDTPFDNNVIRRMSVLGWVLLGYAAIIAVTSAVTACYEESLSLYGYGDSFNGHALFSLIREGVIELIDMNEWHFPALVVLFLTKIFRYGAQLQKESDETL